MDSTALRCQPRRRLSGRDANAIARCLVCVIGPLAVAAAEPPTWDVEASFGPTQDVTLDVREGTWMSIDVHPSGQRICFDLLGDLYELPIRGGDARKLTDGAAWDMAPRYSPDGKHIAFVSDRGGGDNLWRIPADVAGPEAARVAAKPLSSESFRLVSAPAWTPDGRFVAGRKHLTGTRSLGAGEIWLYPAHAAVDGKATGLQATVKPNDQKDFGEPSFSPDGRWLYISRDATDGAVFEYNKDPNVAIYAIFRIDRHSGRVERFIAGPGGAIRPTPSPDGRSLAWIRRHRSRTVLMLRDLATGSDRVLDTALDRDLQETWAIHGVYPHLAFTPDSRSLVYWATGKLWRLELGAVGAAAPPEAKPSPPQGDAGLAQTVPGAKREIPFHVRDRRRVHAALRWPQRQYEPSFDVRMVRHPALSPDGALVAFEALGQLWLHEVNGGKRRPLAADPSLLQAMPAWSGDGSALAFVSWDDARAGQLWLWQRKAGRAAPLAQQPGHYVEPALSRDASVIVYRRVSGGGLRMAAHGVEPGIYAAETRAGAGAGGQRTPWLVSRDGFGPHFGPEADRVYLARPGAEQRLELWSVGLHDREARLHAQVELATSLRLLPDGRTLAFRADAEAYVAPFAFAAQPLALSADSKAVPVRRVSQHGADFLTAAGPSRLTFAAGATLYAVDAAEPATPTAIALRWSQPALGRDGQPVRGLWAIVGARLVTMRGDEVIEDGTMVVRDGAIAAIGPRAALTVPPGATVVSGQGRTVIPGLVDVHGHGAQAEDGLLPEDNWQMAATLAFGVTTFHDPSSETTAFFAASERQRVGRLLAPRLMSTGTILYGAKAPYHVKVESRDDALRHLRRLQAAGAFSAKSYNQPRRAQRQQILSAARELRMLVVPEGGALFHHNMTQVVDGHTGVEHALPLQRVYQDVLHLWSQTAVGHTPTLGVADGGLGAENHWYAKTRVDRHPLLSRFVPDFAIDPRARRPVTAPDEEWNHIEVAKFARDLLRAGGSVQLGAHGQREGLAAHWELWSLVQGGMTPLEALRVGTLLGARYLGLDGDVGSLEVGKRADFAVIDGAPDRDIRSSDRVELVGIGGEVFDAPTLRRQWPLPALPGPRFWFHQPGGQGPGHAVGAACGCGLGRHP